MLYISKYKKYYVYECNFYLKKNFKLYRVYAEKKKSDRKNLAVI